MSMTASVIYKSKIGFEILIPMVLALGAITTIVVMNSAWLALIACVLAWLLLAFIYTKTYYKITADNRLIIRRWIFESWEIETKDILSIRTNSVISSLALSIERLEIIYKGGQVSISPKNKAKFITALRRSNPKIQYGVENWKGINETIL
jgi:hypothetical protein